VNRHNDRESGKENADGREDEPTDDAADPSGIVANLGVAVHPSIAQKLHRLVSVKALPLA